MSDIRLARPDDAQAIHLILQETWGESLLSDVFINHISSPEHQIFVAVDGGEVAGFLSAFLVPKPTPRWEIDLIIVRSTSREKGIGASLIFVRLEIVFCMGSFGLPIRHQCTGDSSGLWIEGFIERLEHENRLNTGLFMPDSFKHTAAPDLLTAATNFGQYHWWQYAFK